MTRKGEGSWLPPPNEWEDDLGHLHSGFISPSCSAAEPSSSGLSGTDAGVNNSSFAPGKQTPANAQPVGLPDSNSCPGQQAGLQFLTKDDCQQPECSGRFWGGALFGATDISVVRLPFWVWVTRSRGLVPTFSLADGAQWREQ